MLKFVLIAALALSFGGSESGGGGSHASRSTSESTAQPQQPEQTDQSASRVEQLAESGAERITNYASDIRVEKNGQLDVAETISVLVTGDQIHHGIYRDFPTRYEDRYGAKVHVRFDVTAVTMDGKDEPYATEDISNGVRVKIGDADTDVEHGNHVYKISYITAHQVGFFKDYDELYWNVTGMAGSSRSIMPKRPSICRPAERSSSMTSIPARRANRASLRAPTSSPIPTSALKLQIRFPLTMD